MSVVRLYCDDITMTNWRSRKYVRFIRKSWTCD